MKTVVVSMSTRDQTFSNGEVDGPYLYMLRDKSGVNADLTSKDSGTSVTFPNVPAGFYTAVVSKLGFEATADFEVPSDDETFQVPDVINVTVS